MLTENNRQSKTMNTSQLNEHPVRDMESQVVIVMSVCVNICLFLASLTVFVVNAFVCVCVLGCLFQIASVGKAYLKSGKGCMQMENLEESK